MDLLNVKIIEDLTDNPIISFNPSLVLHYDGSDNLDYIDLTINSITYRKTLTYTVGNLTGVSIWVVQ